MGSNPSSHFLAGWSQASYITALCLHCPTCGQGWQLCAHRAAGRALSSRKCWEGWLARGKLWAHVAVAEACLVISSQWLHEESILHMRQQRLRGERLDGGPRWDGHPAGLAPVAHGQRLSFRNSSLHCRYWLSSSSGMFSESVWDHWKHRIMDPVLLLYLPVDKTPRGSYMLWPLRSTAPLMMRSAPEGLGPGLPQSLLCSGLRQHQAQGKSVRNTVSWSREGRLQSPVKFLLSSFQP